MRKTWVGIHKWIGLLIGALLVMQGLTGSWNVFYREIDGIIDREFWKADSSEPWLSLDRLVGEATARCVGHETGDVRIDFPPDSGSALAISCLHHGVDSVVTVAPKTAKILGVREKESGLSYTIYHLHSEWLMGASSRLIMLGIALTLVTSSLTGLYLWWPRRGMWRHSFSIRKKATGHQLWFDLHRIGGLYAFPFLAIAGFTGIYLAVPNAFVDGVARIASVQSWTGYEQPIADLDDAGSAIGAQRALEIAKREYPRARIGEIVLPANDETPVLVVFRQPDEWIEHGGDSVAWLHPQTGAIIGGYDSAADAGPGDSFIHALFPLHSGQAFGPMHKWLVFLSGLAPALLFITGFLLWRRESRRSREVRRMQRTLPAQAARASASIDPEARVSRT